MTTETIRINEICELSGGVFEFDIPTMRLHGCSRQPLLEACRLIKSAGGNLGAKAELYRTERSPHPLVSCWVGIGAELTVINGTLTPLRNTARLPPVSIEIKTE